MDRRTWTALTPSSWRDDLLRVVLRATAVFGGAVYLPSVWFAAAADMYALVVLDTAAIAVIVGLALSERVPATARAVAAAAVFYALGAGLMVTVGSISQIYLFGFSILTTLLLGHRPGLATVALNAVTVWGIGLAGIAAPDMGIAAWTMNSTGWTVVSANFVFVDLCLVLALGTVIGALEAALADAIRGRDQLGAEIEGRRKLEEQLLQAKKLEAIGSLAGGVAHDFNNLLSVVLSYADLALDHPGLPAGPRGDLTEIRKAALRAAELTHQLLAFGRKQILKPEVIDANQVVDAVGTMMGRVVGTHIEVVQHTSPDLGRCHVDRGQLEQVLVNLVVNARDAMPDGGRITIETSNTGFDAAYASTHAGVTAGRYVTIAVTDTGVGMDKETVERVFDPFFTTKDKGKGTGLGLSIAHGIVRQSGGHLWVYSELGFGTTFTIHLPRTDDARTEFRPSSLPPTSLRGSETVLLVEDDPQVLEVTRSVLARQGYTVVTAPSGPDALVTCAAHRGPLDLLLTDVVMPKMSGRQLAEEVVQARPGLRVLFVSGYTGNTVFPGGVLPPGVAFLQKPVMPDVLVRAVRELLDAPPPAR